MYDILEVLFLHKPGSDKAKNLALLQERIQPDFEVEAHEFITATELDCTRQVIRIIEAGCEYKSAQEFESAVRLLASQDEFPWQRIGVVPAGETETIAA